MRNIPGRIIPRIGIQIGLALTLMFGAAVHAQVAPECVPAVQSLKAGDLEAGAEQLAACADVGFGVERAQARLLIAEVHARQGRLDDALQVLDDLERSAPLLTEVEPAELANGEVSIGTPGYLRRGARSIAPVIGQANYMRVIYLLEMGEPLRAARVVRELIDAEYSTVQEESLLRIRREEMSLVQMAAALQKAGDAALCARFMREIPLESSAMLPLRAAQISAFAVLYASCHQHAGAVDAGIAHYEEQFRARPAGGLEAPLSAADASQRNLFTAMLVAEARLRMGQDDFGERTRMLLDQAIAKGASVPEPRYMRAYLHLRRGDTERAQVDAQQAEQLLPGHPAHDQFVSLVEAIERRL
jgi:tetratricopeptide (TPR) repeat protein